jgi:hypothetical protein
MRDFDYAAPAELYVAKRRGSRRGSLMRYIRFPTSADAIKYAVESLEISALLSASLVVGDDRYDGQQIRDSYDGHTYPLERSTSTHAR